MSRERESEKERDKIESESEEKTVSKTSWVGGYGGVRQVSETSRKKSTAAVNPTESNYSSTHSWPTGIPLATNRKTADEFPFSFLYFSSRQIARALSRDNYFSSGSRRRFAVTAYFRFRRFEYYFGSGGSARKATRNGDATLVVVVRMLQGR